MATAIGDFNSHHELWNYKRSDGNGQYLVRWAEHNDVHLLFDIKDRGTFRLAAWKQDYNPDLCFVTADENNHPLAASRKVLIDFPHSQHRPVIVEIGISTALVIFTPRPRWKFEEADWTTFATDLDKILGCIPPTPKEHSQMLQRGVYPRME
ncbi:hypothetical protein JTB14_024976 [Gonioctena quinquepunctata]|nr:hypothetical protein JTB14_024976 [Gonioctena quinquepunctata]